jgi:hypothetical protein
MSNWSITNSSLTPGSTQGTQQAVSATYKTQVVMFGSSASLATGLATGSGIAKREKWFDLLLGTNSAPGDTYIEWDVARVSALSSQITPATTTLSSVSSACVTDPGDQYGFLTFAAVNMTAETGITMLSEAWYFGMNQRASYRWIANPGDEIVMPANLQTVTTFPGNGLDLRVRGNYTGTVTATVRGLEL